MENFKRASYQYQDGQLKLIKESGEAVELDALLKKSEVPVYVYSQDVILKRIRAYKEAFSNFKHHIHYAVKANPNLEILKLMKAQGLGADVVSIGEFNRALEAGFEPADIIFSGVGKTKKEIQEALQKGVFQINCESLPEIKRVGELAQNLNLQASIGVRINPDIPVDTHPYIATGFRENKFGIPLYQLPEVSKLVLSFEGALKLQGVSCHIGSQIMDTDSLIKALESILKVRKELQEKGHQILHLDLGGGLGVDYHSDDEEKDLLQIQEYGQKIKDNLQGFEGQLLFEPGRSLVARAGLLLVRVEYVKTNGFKNFIVVNSGMHHLLRPSLYSAYHKILPLQEGADQKTKIYDVVGPICESSDVLGYDRLLSEPSEGEGMAILDAGAYGMSMASAYNLHDFPLEVLI